MAAVFLRNSGELEPLRGHVAAAGASVYTLFAHEWFALKRQGVTARLLSEMVPDAEVETIYARAFADAGRLADAAALEPGTVNLGRCFKVYYWEFLTELYTLDLAFTRLLAGDGSGELVFLDKALPRLTAHAQLMDTDAISTMVVNGLARTRKNVRRIGAASAPPPAEAGGPVDAPGLRTALAALKHSLRARLRGDAPARRTIGVGSGYDALTVLPDVARLSARSGCPPMLVANHIDRETTRTGLVWREEYVSIPTSEFSRAPRLGSLRQLTGAPRRGARAFAAVMAKLDGIPEAASHGAGAFLAPLRAEYERTARDAVFLDDFLRQHTGSDLVVTHFNGVEERVIEQLASRHGVRLYARPHGWMNSLEVFEYRADRYYCNGPLNAEFVQRYYRYGTRVELSADPSIVDAGNEWTTADPETRRSRRDAKRAELAIGATSVVLLMTTAARHGRALNEFDPRRWSETWATLLDLANARPDVHFVVKSHKHNFDAQVAELARARRVGNLTVMTGRLEEALSIADIAVDLGKPGSATLAALMFEVPLLLYRGMYRYVRPFGDAVHEHGRAFRYDSAAELAVELGRLLDGGPSAFAQLVDRNSTLRALLAETQDASAPLSPSLEGAVR